MELRDDADPFKTADRGLGQVSPIHTIFAIHLGQLDRLAGIDK